jgi:protein-disulfide isomerase-like protein with CxxC motif
MMNKKIQELTGQCWSHYINGVLIDGHLHFDSVKFANLIIQEIEAYIQEAEGDIDYVRFLIDRNLK